MPGCWERWIRSSEEGDLVDAVGDSPGVEGVDLHPGDGDAGRKAGEGTADEGVDRRVIAGDSPRYNGVDVEQAIEVKSVELEKGLGGGGEGDHGGKGLFQ